MSRPPYTDWKSRPPAETRTWVAVCGTRTFNDYALLKRKLDHFLGGLRFPVILTGGAKGADQLAERWAGWNWHLVKKFHANWTKYGIKAGPIRNSKMVAEADVLIAFWDGESPGTKDAIKKAKKKGIPVRIVRYDE